MPSDLVLHAASSIQWHSNERNPVLLLARRHRCAALFSPQTHCADMLKYQAPGLSLTITKADATPASAPGTLRISPNFPGTVGVAVPALLPRRRRDRQTHRSGRETVRHWFRSWRCPISGTADFFFRAAEG